jgi:microcystin-dependent protein
MAYANSISTEGTTGSAISTRATYANPSGVVTGSSSVGVSIQNHTTGIALTSVGGGGNHNVMQPYAVMNYIIRV